MWFLINLFCKTNYCCCFFCLFFVFGGDCYLLFFVVVLGFWVFWGFVCVCVCVCVCGGGVVFCVCVFFSVFFFVCLINTEVLY